MNPRSRPKERLTVADANPRKRRTLQDELDELERTDPAVAEAAARLDAVRDHILGREPKHSNNSQDGAA